jgi:hypothetical protein
LPILGLWAQTSVVSSVAAFAAVVIGLVALLNGRWFQVSFVLVLVALVVLVVLVKRVGTN